MKTLDIPQSTVATSILISAWQGVNNKWKTFDSPMPIKPMRIKTTVLAPGMLWYLVDIWGHWETNKKMSAL